MNPTTERARDRVERFTVVVEGAAGRWDAPTPCSDWTVSDVVHHVVDSQHEFLLARGLLAERVTDADADPADQWRRHRADVLDVLARDGVPETEYDGYFGRTTIGDTLADFYGWDLVIHSWDVARATGQPWRLGDDEADQLGRTADGWGDALYSAGICGPAVDLPADASPQDRLLGRLGRDPQWAA